ncbi:MAG: hypothetical protein A3H34_08240 [Betaproteobacteria bacterium RIFCSPLOWO2_02_FULL_67_19]|nr:MAG: hypothetical protein A3H34_08240 [Betaproteobacteria bacterium RIFCSPLOWO2_02_FULL_67_19]
MEEAQDFDRIAAEKRPCASSSSPTIQRARRALMRQREAAFVAHRGPVSLRGAMRSGIITL